MNIYISHSRGFDFQNALYKPIRESALEKEHTFILPHEGTRECFDSRTLFHTGCDLVIAEVTYPSTGLGIELGWANMRNIPIVCLSQKGASTSRSLPLVAKVSYEYSGTEELLSLIEKAIREITDTTSQP